MAVSYQNRIKRLLTEFPVLRDDDKRLIWKVLIDCGVVIDGVISRDKFYAWKGNTEAIRRARQKVQELHPELRGKSYKVRQSHAKVARKTYGNSVISYSRYHD